MSKQDQSEDKSRLARLQYPIGKFECPRLIEIGMLQEWINSIAALPTEVENAIAGWDDTMLDTPYRPQGWTVRQLVHHLADSHHHSYVRFKWALTEENPVIKAYDEKAWAELFDARIAPVGLAIQHLHAVHGRWVYLLNGMSQKMLQRTFIHPETGEVQRLDENIGKYAWHGRHHLAQIQNFKVTMGYE
jgi:hypothetical protein